MLPRRKGYGAAPALIGGARPTPRHEHLLLVVVYAAGCRHGCRRGPAPGGAYTERPYHFCLGVALARLEGQIALGTLFRRFPTLRLETMSEALPRMKGIVFRGVEALPVSIA